MAPRKPKLDLPNPGDIVDWMRGVHDTARVAAGDRPAMTPGDKGVRTMGRGVSMANDMLNPYSNTTKKLLGYAAGQEGSGTQLMKSLAVDAAITAAGAGATIGAMKAGKAVVNTGIPARVRNAVRGETILVHGSPMQNLKTIEPRLNSARFPNEKVAYGWNPKAFLPQDKSGIVGNALGYTGNLSSSQASGFTRLRGTMRAPSTGGSVYITRGKTSKNIVTDPNENFMMAIRGETPVVKEFKVSNYIGDERGASYLDSQGIRKDVHAALKKAGVKMDKNPVEKLLDKVEAAKMAKRQRIRNQQSVV
jgi:hypothetical protein